VISDREDFCLHLKETRERSGLTLEAIGALTKINPALLAGLERGDVSRWPRGIFRRSFLREYATAIGLSPDQAVAEFCRHFPEDDPAFGALPRVPLPTGTGLRLTLAPDRRWWSEPNRARALAAILDASVVVLIAGAAAWVLPTSFWATAGAVALIYYTSVGVCTGTTAASLWLKGRERVHLVEASEPVAQAAADGPRLVFRREELALMAVSEIEEAEGEAHADLRAASH
jgi:transcriptional regulator with XRE-family HTH domain